MGKLRNIFMICLGLSLGAWGAWFTILQFSNPALTRKQLALQTWQGIIPIAIFALLLAIVEYIRTRK